MGNGFVLSLKKQIRAGQLVGVYRVEFNKVAISAVAAGAGIGFGSRVIDDFPVGNIALFGVVGRVGFTKIDSNIIATWSGNWAVGSTPTAAGALTVAGEFDILGPSGGTAIGPAVSGSIPGTRVLKAGFGTPIILDNTGGTLELNLNLSVAAASITDATTGVVQATGCIDMIMGLLP